MSGLTIDGVLAGGATVDGVVHRAFTLRLPTVADNIDAVDEVGSHNPVAVNAAILAKQLVKLGTLQAKQITFELVAGLHPSDFNVIDQMAQELEKKRRAAQAAGSNTSSSDSSFAAPA